MARPMIRLHQSFGVHAGRVAEFDQACVRVGRMPDSDLAFHPQGDLDASGRHAEIRRVEAVWRVVDVGSRNGTYLNGEPVEDEALSDGDELEFGEGGPRLRVEILSEEGGGEAAGDPAERVSRAEVFPTGHPPERLSASVPPPDPSEESRLRDALLATRHGDFDVPDPAPTEVRRLKRALFVVSALLLFTLAAFILRFIE